MASLRLRCVAVVLAIALALSVPAAATQSLHAGSQDVDQPTGVESILNTTDDESQSSTNGESRDGEPSTDSQSGGDGEPGTIGPAVQSADGTIEVIVRVENVDLPLYGTQATTDVVNELKSHASESQAPVIEYVETTDGLSLRNSFWLSNSLLIEVDTDRVDVSTLAAQEGVDEIHENFNVEAPSPTPAEASNFGGETTYGLDQINATEVWDEYDTRGQGVSVAVLDTGVDASHPDIDLGDGDWSQFDKDGNPVDSEPNDFQGHGTHTSGTVTGGNASGTQIGVAPGADLMHSRVLDPDGGSFAQIVAGLQWAVDNDADVISMSLGASGKHDNFIEPVRNAQSAGSIVVAAVGNNNEGTSGSPANVYDSFAIGAADENGDIAVFSGGETIQTQKAWVDPPAEWPDEYVVPDVAAPGVGVLSSVPGGDWGTADGTSMATPHVSGAIALMLSAASDDPRPAKVMEAFESTAWKPDGEPTYQDTRYGHGIIDAKAAIDRVAADSGITGNVTDANGGPIAGATVELQNYTVTTDETGSYEHHATAGEYNLTADAFGYSSTTASAIVSNGSFTRLDFQLSSELAVQTETRQPEAVEGGEAIETTVNAAHVSNLTVSNAGTAANLTAYVDGERAPLNETIRYDGPSIGPIDVRVETFANTSGTVELVHTFEGANDSVEVSTGSTEVIEQYTEVAIVKENRDASTARTEKFLETGLGPHYNISTITAGEVAYTPQDQLIDSYDAFVVQGLGDSERIVEPFIRKTKTPELGVVYLEQWDDAANSIGDRSRAIDNPREVQQRWGTFWNPPISYRIDSNHPIFDGVGTKGDVVDLYTSDKIDQYSAFHASYQGYDGDFNPVGATAIASTHTDEVTGVGMSVENNSRTVLAASLSPDATGLIKVHDFEGAGLQILNNSVEWASTTPSAYPTAPPDRRIDPGESTTVPVESKPIDRFKVDVVGGTLNASDLTLQADCPGATIGEYCEFNGTKDVSSFPVTVQTDENAVGSFELEYTFETVTAENGAETTSFRTGITSVYEPPLEVPTDAATLDEALEIVVSDGEIVVDDGTYANVDATEGGTNTGYVLDTEGVTIRAADGADPTVLLNETAGPAADNRVFDVRANDVTLAGLSINALENGSYEKPVLPVHYEKQSGLTLEDVRLAGDRALHYANVDGLDVTDTAVTRVDTLAFGTMEYWYDNPWSTDLRFDNVTVDGATANAESAIVLSMVQNASITHSDVSGGIDLRGPVANATIANTRVSNASDGVILGHGRGRPCSDCRVVDSEIRATDTGITVYDATDEVDLVRNEIHATEGVRIQPLIGGTEFSRYDDNITADLNDVSDTDVGFVLGGSGQTAIDGNKIDVRRNYLGDAAVEGTDLVSDPFLTEPMLGDDVEPADADRLGTDLELEAGETYAIGVPGPTTQTLGEVFADGFEGVVYGFDAGSQSWERLSGDDSLDAMQALLIVAESDATATLHFQTENLPPGPAQTSLSEGWNFVAAPTYDSAEGAFGLATADVTMAMNVYDRPADQLAPAGQLNGTHVLAEDGPRVSPFEGYFVFAEEDGILPATLSADPTMSHLYRQLGAPENETIPVKEPESRYPPASYLGSFDRETQEAILANALHAEMRAQLGADASPRDALNVTETVHSQASDELDVDSDILESAVERATTRLLVQEFDIAVDATASDADGSVTRTDDAGSSAHVSPPA